MTALIIGTALDAVTFATLAALPGVMGAERNPLTVALVSALGLSGYVTAKIALAGFAALLSVRVSRYRALLLTAVVVGWIGAASNLWASAQLAAA